MASPLEQVTRSAEPFTEGAKRSRFRLVRYFGSAWLVRTSDEGARVALVLLTLERTGDAALGGVLVAALLVPHVVAAPVVGRLVDQARHPGRVLAAAVVLFGSGLILAAVLVGRAPTWWAIAALAVAGCGGPAITGGLTSRLGVMVAERKHARAFGLDSLFYNVASMAGPAGVALVSAAAGPGTATVALGCLAAVGAVGVLTLRLDGAAPKQGRPSRGGGFGYIARNPALRTLTVTTTLGQIGPGALAVVAAVIGADLGRPEVGGLILATVAAGSLVGSLVWTWRPLPDRWAPAVTGWSMIGVGVLLALSALFTSSANLLGWTALLLGVSGVFIGPFAAALFLARNQLAAPAVRAQVFTIGAGLKVTASAAGAALIGLAADQPPSTQLLLIAAAPLVAGLLGVWLLRRPER